MAHKRSSSKLLLKIGLLSASMLIGIQMSISPAIPAMREFYSGLSREAVESLTTVQNVSGFVMILACPWVSAHLGKKRSVLLALIVSALAGMVPAIASTYAVVLASRIVFGVGVGLDCGLAMSMIGDFFEGNERATLMGIRSSVETLGNIICTTLAGVLLNFGWQPVFWVYALLFVPVALFALGVPTDKPHADVEVEDKPKQHINLAVILLFVLYFTFVTCNCGFCVRISSVVTENGLGTASQSSMVISAQALAGMICGLLFGKIRSALGMRTPVLGLLLMAAGMVLGAHATSLVAMTVAAVIAGAANTIVIPFLTDYVGNVCPKGSNTLATSVMVSGGFAAASLTPMVLSLIANLTHDASATAPFLPLAGVCVSVAALLFFVLREPRTAKADHKATMEAEEQALC